MDEHVTVVAQVADARLHSFASSKAPGQGPAPRSHDHGRQRPAPTRLLRLGSSQTPQGTPAGHTRDVRRQGLRLQPPTSTRASGVRVAEGRRRGSGGDLGGHPDPHLPRHRQAGVLEDRQGPSDGTPQRPGSRRPPPGLPPRGPRPGLLPEALLKIHRPHTRADIAAARDRLKWDEAFVLQVALARRRHADAQLPAVARKPTPDGLLTAFDDRLPFTLTDGQVKVSKEIFDDLATEHPMHRLLQGRSVAERPWWPSAPCSPSSTRVGRPRCSRPPKCSLSSITGRSPR